MTSPAIDKELVEEARKIMSLGSVWYGFQDEIVAALKSIRDAERERCAKIAEGYVLTHENPQNKYDDGFDTGEKCAVRLIAAAIRET